MTRPRCDHHGNHCPAGSHRPDDDSTYSWDGDTLTGRDYDQAADDAADLETGWGR